MHKRIIRPDEQKNKFLELKSWNQSILLMSDKQREVLQQVKTEFEQSQLSAPHVQLSNQISKLHINLEEEDESHYYRRQYDNKTRIWAKNEIKKKDYEQ